MRSDQSSWKRLCRMPKVVSSARATVMSAWSGDVVTGRVADVSGIRQLTEHTWDSLAHVSLVSAIESEFGITIDTGDAIELTSFEAMRLYLEDAVR